MDPSSRDSGGILNGEGRRESGARIQETAEQGLRLRVTITVQPDEFYTRFFEAMLTAGAGKGEARIAEALEATRRSAYTLYEADLPLS